MVRQRADRDEVYAAFGIFAQVFQRDAARRFGFVPSADQRDRLAGRLRREVVEHDPVYAAYREHFADVVQRSHLDFDRDIFAFLFQVGLRLADRRRDAAGEVDVVVLEDTFSGNL